MENPINGSVKHTPDQLRMVSGNEYPYVHQTSEEKTLGMMELPECNTRVVPYI